MQIQEQPGLPIKFRSSLGYKRDTFSNAFSIRTKHNDNNTILYKNTKHILYKMIILIVLLGIKTFMFLNITSLIINFFISAVMVRL